MINRNNILYEIKCLTSRGHGIGVVVSYNKLYATVDIQNNILNPNHQHLELAFFCIVSDLYKNSNSAVKQQLKSNLKKVFDSEFSFCIDPEPFVNHFSKFSPVIHEDYWANYYLTFGELEQARIKEQFKGRQIKTGNTLFDIAASNPGGKINTHFSNPVYLLSSQIDSDDFPPLTKFYFYICLKDNTIKLYNYLGKYSNILYPLSMTLILNKMYSQLSKIETSEFKAKGRIFSNEIDVLSRFSKDALIKHLEVKIR